MKKSSMSNYIRVTILKAKILGDANLASYNLRMEFCKQVHETDKISGKDVEMGKVNFTLSSELFF